jgi:hypothetical protein
VFYSFEERNKAIRKILVELSAHPFQKRPGSRHNEFMAIEKPAFGTLPAYRYEIA